MTSSVTKLKGGAEGGVGQQIRVRGVGAPQRRGNCASLQLWAYVSIGRNALLTPPLSAPLLSLIPPPPPLFAHLHLLIDFWGSPPSPAQILHALFSHYLGHNSPHSSPMTRCQAVQTRTGRGVLYAASKRISEPTERRREEGKDLLSHTADLAWSELEETCTYACPKANSLLHTCVCKPHTCTPACEEFGQTVGFKAKVRGDVQKVGGGRGEKREEWKRRGRMNTMKTMKKSRTN